MYSSSRTIFLLTGELALIFGSFLLALFISFRDGQTLVFWASMWKLIAATCLMLLCAYYMEMYDLAQLSASRETLVRILRLIGIVAFILGIVAFAYPKFLMGKNTFFVALL